MASSIQLKSRQGPAWSAFQQLGPNSPSLFILTCFSVKHVKLTTFSPSVLISRRSIPGPKCSMRERKVRELMDQ